MLRIVNNSKRLLNHLHKFWDLTSAFSFNQKVKMRWHQTILQQLYAGVLLQRLGQHSHKQLADCLLGENFGPTVGPGTDVVNAAIDEATLLMIVI
jgi:hypothetical protein